jgi:diguanylate cyclase (GGDEF)-like protein
MPRLPTHESAGAADPDLADALEVLDIGLLLLDPALRARYFNRRFIEIFALPPEMLTRPPAYDEILAHCARSMWDYLPPKERADYIARRSEGVRNGTMGLTQVSLADGQQFRFTCDVTADGGRVLTYLEISGLLRQGAEEAMAQVSAEMRFSNETLETQAAYLATLAEEAEQSALRAETARAMLEREIEERRQLEAQLRRIATTDGLTGALNRSAFMTAGEQEIERARKTGQELALLMLDADHFKLINDRFGHAGGDLTLRHLVTTCSKVVREGDLVGRLGGEEFAIVLPGATVSTAEGIAERLRTEVADARLSHGDQVIRVTVSIGLALLQPHDASIEQVVARADAALYRAKDSGRNRVVLDEAA